VYILLYIYILAYFYALVYSNVVFKCFSQLNQAQTMTVLTCLHYLYIKVTVLAINQSCNS